MEWCISRTELGERIIRHSNKAFIKGQFSLSADGIKWRFKKPVTLVFKLYPDGIGQDENQSVSLEVLVECRSSDLKLLGTLNLDVLTSMQERREFVSSKSIQNPLKNFVIHDFLPHEVVTHGKCQFIHFTVEAFISFGAPDIAVPDILKKIK